MTESVAARIQKMRKKKNIPLTTLADHVGLSYADLVEVEANKKQLSDADIKQFADALSVNVAYLKSGNVFIDHTDDLLDAFKKLDMEEQHDFIALFSTLRKPKK